MKTHVNGGMGGGEDLGSESLISALSVFFCTTSPQSKSGYHE